MRTVRNSFPILWSIWKSPSSPPFPSALAFALCPHCQWHHLKFSTLHHLLLLLLLRLPPARPFYPFMSPDFIRLPLSKTFLPCPLHRPPLSLTSPPPPHLPSPLLCLVYTRLLACPLSFQPLKAFQAANKRQVPTTTKGLSAAFE